MPVSQYELKTNQKFQNLRNLLRYQPLYLGAISGENGGSGGPPGGIIGQLTQRRVAFDTTEAETMTILPSGSLLDNLNRIRYRIAALEVSGGGGGNPVDIYEDGILVSSDVDGIDFRGGVTITPGNIPIIVVSGGGGTDLDIYRDSALVKASIDRLTFSTDFTVVASGDGALVGISPTGGAYFVEQAISGGDTGSYGVISGALDGINDTFEVSNSYYSTGSLKLYLNGQLLRQSASGEGYDWYEENSGLGIFKLATAPQADDILVVSYLDTENSFVPASAVGNVVHLDVANEFSSIAEKVSLAAADRFLIEDSEASGGKKYIQGSNVGGGSEINAGAFASLPAAGNAGNAYLSTDGSVISRDTGIVWNHWGPIFPITPLDLTDFTWENQGTATAVQSGSSIYMSAPAVSGDQIRMLKKSSPSSPYTVTIGFIPAMHSTDYNQAGIGLRESSTGKLVTLYFVYASGIQIAVNKWNSTSSYNSQYVTRAFILPSVVWMKIENTGTNFVFSYSSTGLNFIELYSVSNTDFLATGEDELFMYVDSNNATCPCAATFLSWKEE
jgi:hypothetical protein